MDDEKTYPCEVEASEVVNSIFGTGLFKIKGGRAMYDEVYMRDGGEGMYLVRLNADLTQTFRWIEPDTILIQMYDPMAH